VLASASPRRRALLAELGLAFEVRPSDVDESVLPNEDPGDYVRRLAVEKARAAWRPGELVLGADTTVVLDGEILGKPADAAEARVMLCALAGRRHLVLSGVALVRAAEGASERAGEGALGRDADIALEHAGDRELECVALVERTEVEMRMTPREIDWYIASGEVFDKAGAYAIQGRGSLFVTANFGSHSNVVGLPVGALPRLFARLGEDILDRLPSFAAGSD
jgi:septum formation protein